MKFEKQIVGEVIFYSLVTLGFFIYGYITDRYLIMDLWIIGISLKLIVNKYMKKEEEENEQE